jgi:hypothetical protein
VKPEPAVALTLDAEDGTEVIHAFKLTPGEILVINGDEAFERLYRTTASPDRALEFPAYGQLRHHSA